ncbi:uncharacterized protein LOC120422219 [Culex pipiens pallens]|uniref:uncharacterized protein LOC120422219 n=1 Tax=Culex pipiens pallens TaxID=42434 RepID=UPI001952E6E2|nr:uncharacterized protein LOC120422219 [Culex pipiens pallens]
MISTNDSAPTWFQWASDQRSLWEVISRSNCSHAGPTIDPLVTLKDRPGAAVAGSELVSVGTMLSSAQLGLLTGVLMILFIRHKLTRLREESAESKAYNFLKQLNMAEVRRFLFVLVTFLQFCILSPILLLVFFAFRLYRGVIGIILSWRHGAHFMGLLDGADVVWAIERDNSRGMINIMAYIEESADGQDSSTSAEMLLVLRKRISSRLMGAIRSHPKMFWLRKLELGYYYWSDLSDLTIEDYIRYLEYIPLEADERYIDERKLRSLMSEINNRYLLRSHTASWEILVGRQPLLDEKRNVLRFPVIFRVHHSLGDGVALLRLLLESIVDKEVPSRWKRLSNFKAMNLEYRIQQNANRFLQQRSLIEKLYQRIPTARQIYTWKRQQLQLLWTIFTAPAFFHDVSARAVDHNCIHASELSNQKVVSWIHEEEHSDTHWVEVIKRTKQQLPGARFSDAFLTALSSSLQKYLSRKTDQVPEDITVVLPTRVERESPQLKLHNKFSVALQTLPITSGIDLSDPNRMQTLMSRLNDVKQHSDALRSSPDYMINYWIMNTVACLFPDNLLRKILNSAHSTMAISNLPGPQQKPQINGRELKNLSFWIPNIGQTAVGLTLLTYGGKLQLGILADRAVIATEDDAHSILAETIAEIERMDVVLKGE